MLSSVRASPTLTYFFACIQTSQALVTVDKKIVTLKTFIEGVELELRAQQTTATNTEELIGGIQADVDAEIARAQKHYNTAIEEVNVLRDMLV